MTVGGRQMSLGQSRKREVGGVFVPDVSRLVLFQALVAP